MKDLHRLEIRLSTLLQLFNSLDPSPFHEKDLDRDAEEYIVGWANEFPPQAAFELVIRLPADQLDFAERSDIGKAIHNYFAYRAEETRRRVRFQLRQGRMALAIGLAFLFACMTLREFVGLVVPNDVPSRILHEGLLILGWVAMWRPLEIFLYDWWPVRHYALLYDRLAAMPVKLLAAGQAEWGAAPAGPSSPPTS